ncbi:MAG: hypothetical protein ACLQVI_12280 [Polyangiaceae bacterium]
MKPVRLPRQLGFARSVAQLAVRGGGPSGTIGTSDRANIANMTTTSRGKLDATGTGETTWQLDRRVDLDLQ